MISVAADELADQAWGNLEKILWRLADRIRASNAGIEVFIGRSSNEAFPLRAYLSVLKGKGGDELSITVDLKHCARGVSLEADVVLEGGAIVAEGPFLEFDKHWSRSECMRRLNEWLHSFELTLSEKFPDIQASIDTLSVC